MVFTGAQITAFFEAADQMGLAHRTRVFLQSEGITDVIDLEEFITRDSWHQVLENCKRPPRIPDPAGGGGMVEDQAYRIGAKSLRRLKVAAKCVAYYVATGRELTAANMRWNTRLSFFEASWKALEDLKDGDSDNKLPILTRNFPIDRWIESYSNYADQRIGARTCPLSYVLREEAVVPADVPALATGQPYSTMHGSIKNEMIARYSHVHALFSVDNGAVFDDLEEATRGTKYQNTVSTFKRAKNGRGAYMALKTQYTGSAVWDRKKSDAMEFLQSRKFTGTSSITLEAFLGQHRSTFVTLERCAENITCQLPDERTRVQFLLDNILAEDFNVKAALSSIRLDDTPGGMRNNFERAVAFLMPTDPVEKKKAKNKRSIAEVSAVESEERPPRKNLGGHKQGRGKSGVEFRYHTPEEYNALNKEQRQELHAHRKKNPSAARSFKKKDDKKKRYKASVSAIAKEAWKEMEEEKAKAQEAKDADRKELHEALVAALKVQRGDGGMNSLKARVASIESEPSKKSNGGTNISSVTLPKGKGGKGVHLAQAPQVENPFCEDAANASAEVAATRLLDVVERMRSGATGKKNGPQ